MAKRQNTMMNFFLKKPKLNLLEVEIKETPQPHTSSSCLEFNGYLKLCYIKYKFINIPTGHRPSVTTY
ncbi:hypothetical protein QTP88_020746 [Uroleucon formosanum]